MLALTLIIAVVDKFVPLLDIGEEVFAGSELDMQVCVSVCVCLCMCVDRCVGVRVSDSTYFIP